MSNNKLNYNQYKHLIDVFTTGDFSVETLGNPVGLVTYKEILTEDNILYFTQNTKRTCRVPLGISKRDGDLKQINLMDDGFTYRYGSRSVLDNFARLTICCLLQNYNPNEYEVYYDLEIRDLNSLDNFHFISSTEMLNNVYSDLARERHKRYAETGDYSYKEYRKSHDDKLIIFILTNGENINVIRSISGAHNRYGIAILNLEQHEIANSSSISLANTIRPNIDDSEMDNEIKIHKKMLGVLNKMINEINLITGEIIDKGDLHENLVIKLPFGDEEKALYEKLKTKAESRDENSEEYYELYENLEELQTGYAIYNMREYGYQFGGIHANGDCGSFYHHLLRASYDLDKEALEYIIRASVYTLFSHCSPKLEEALRGQEDLSSKDKEILDSYISRQVTHYAVKTPWFSLADFDEDMEDSSAVLYETFFCKVELENKRLYITIGDKKRKLPDYLLVFFDLGKMQLNSNLLELIIRFELYKEYGMHTPSGIFYDWYTEENYILSHQPLDYSLEELNERLGKVKDSSRTYDKLSYHEYKDLISSAYKDKSSDEISSYINYWIWKIKDFRQALSKDTNDNKGGKGMKTLNQILAGACEDLVNDYLEEQDVTRLSYEHYGIIRDRSENEIMKELNRRLEKVDCKIPEDVLINYVLEKIKVLAVRHLCDEYENKSSIRKSTSF